MIRLSVEVENNLGLHARAAAKLVQLASGFSSDIFLSRVDVNQKIDSKSILGVLMLAASKGTCLNVSIDGCDELEAGDAIKRFFKSRFGEKD